MPDPSAIGPDLVRRLLRAQFPRWTDLPIQAIEPGGWDNRSFRVGERLVARLPSAACYTAQAEKEGRWLPVLAPGLPCPIPTPVALGRPGELYPWPWGVYEWIEGETAAAAPILDRLGFARSLADFLAALQRIETAGGPPPGLQNFHRGGALAHYDAETREAVDRLGEAVDRGRVLAVWDRALASVAQGPPVWVHGDMSAGNLIVRDGRLAGVIDFGGCAVGDPACDLAPAWTMFEPRERAVFRERLAPGSDSWARGKGWVLWKALITLAGGAPREQRESARVALAQILEDENRAP